MKGETPTPFAEPGSTGLGLVSRAALLISLAMFLCPLSGSAIVLLAKGDINFGGNNISADSYNSTDGPWDALTSGTNGDIACLHGVATLGNSWINGSLLLGEGAAYSLGPAGTITGSVYSNFAMTLPNVTAPYSVGVPLPPATNKSYTLGTGDYLFEGSFPSITTINNLIVKGNPARLYVTGNFSAGSILIQSNATLSLYVAGASTTLAAVNVSGNPTQFRYYGLSTSTNSTIAIAGNDAFNGFIYAPNSVLNASGGGIVGLDFFGAAFVGRAAINGNVSFHFDEAFGHFSLTAPVITLQPLGKSVIAGTNVTFNVQAQSTGDAGYQWRFNGTNIPSANGATYAIANASMASAGDYSVIATNSFGSQISSNATLTVYESAAATLGSVTVTNGNELRFAVSGVPGFKYAMLASTNLTDWTSLATNTAPFTFTDFVSDSQPRRFYRAAYIP